MEMSDAAREARRAYQRAWNAKNQDKNREYMRRYWEKRSGAAAGDHEKNTKENCYDKTN